MGDSQRIHQISLDKIHPNPHQPRRCFAPEALQELARSIRRYGVLQPLIIRKTAGGFELVAGERRLRAARMAGLDSVPCLIRGLNQEDSATLALIENIQRKDLHYLEEAEALQTLIREYHLSQEELAQRVGKSQSAVANKLRLLRLSPECRKLLEEKELSERHARAVLRLEEESLRLEALRLAGERKWTVARLEEYIEQLRQKQLPRGRSCYVIKDVRIFLNTICRSIGLMRSSGVDAQWGREDTEEEIRLLIRIPKRGKQAS